MSVIIVLRCKSARCAAANITDCICVGLLDHVTVLIGVAVKGEPVAGVIHQPYYNYKQGPGVQLGRTIWGIVGLGKGQALFFSLWNVCRWNCCVRRNSRSGWK
jgi:hypothetical protein